MSDANNSVLDDDGVTPVIINKSTLTQDDVTHSASQPFSFFNRGPHNNYSSVELKHLLDISEEILRIGPSEWNKVVETHAVDYPGRIDTSIRRKYNSLHRVTVPTGDSNYPDEVKQAKRIKYGIGQKAVIGGGEEDFGLETGTFSGLGVLNEPPVELASPLPSITRGSTENIQESFRISEFS